ncbi:hypothetical protein C8R46DRAFT_530499 [Mycena filopes]|nr:hypothetical protein C8R46DRAFT_530499 [Mycena filopes]
MADMRYSGISRSPFRASLLPLTSIHPFFRLPDPPPASDGPPPCRRRPFPHRAPHNVCRFTRTLPLTAVLTGTTTTTATTPWLPAYPRVTVSLIFSPTAPWTADALPDLDSPRYRATCKAVLPRAIYLASPLAVSLALPSPVLRSPSRFSLCSRGVMYLPPHRDVFHPRLGPRNDQDRNSRISRTISSSSRSLHRPSPPMESKPAGLDRRKVLTSTWKPEEESGPYIRHTVHASPCPSSTSCRCMFTCADARIMKRFT